MSTNPTPSPKNAVSVATHPAPTTAKPPVTVRVALVLDEKLYDEYSERGAKFGRSVEEELVVRLTACRAHTSTQPIYLTDADRAQFSQALGHLITSPADLLAKLKNIVHLTVGKVHVPLTERQMIRLGTRVMRGETMESVLIREVNRGLDEFLGLR